MIERLTDPLHVKRYLEHPDIWEAICAGVEFDDFDPNMSPDNHYIVTGPQAMFCLHPFPGDDLWQIHAHVHPDYREHALEAAQKALHYAFSELSALKVVAIIPEIFPRVRGFALKCGLRDEGYLSDSYIKHERLYGQWLLAINRRAFEEQ